MMTKLSRMLSSSSSLKYSMSTETSRCRKRMISAALLFRLLSASTGEVWVLRWRWETRM